MVLLHQDWRLVGDELNVEELTFNIEVEQGNSKPWVKELLLGAQLRHKIFLEDFEVKAFYWFYCAFVGGFGDLGLRVFLLFSVVDAY